MVGHDAKVLGEPGANVARHVVLARHDMGTQSQLRGRTRLQVLVSLSERSLVLSNSNGTYLDHGEHLNTFSVVILSNVLGAQQACLLCRVPMELHGTDRAEASVDESTENLQDRDRA